MYFIRKIFEVYGFFVVFLPFALYHIVFLAESIRIIWHILFTDLVTIYYPEDTKFIIYDLFITLPRRLAFKIFYSNIYKGDFMNSAFIFSILRMLILYLIFGFPINILRYFYNLKRYSMI